MAVHAAKPPGISHLPQAACAVFIWFHLLGHLSILEIIGAGRRSRRGDFETTACPLRQLQETAGGLPYLPSE
jgi:hypothetical protein